MPEHTPGDRPSVAEVQARLQEVARMLRDSSHLSPESQADLIALVEELSEALRSSAMPPAEVAHLADSTAHLAESLHHQREEGILGRANERLREAAVRAEVHAPVASGLARRLADTLANWGI